MTTSFRSGLCYLLLLFGGITQVRAEAEIVLSATEPTSKDDFHVAIRNTGDEKINIMKPWNVHILVIDGRRHQVRRTLWWCEDRPTISPGKSFQRPMRLDYYDGIDVGPGKHEIQMELDGVLSNKLEITLPSARKSAPLILPEKPRPDATARSPQRE